MKKKLLSLLLVIAVMMTSVSMGFGSLVATAGAANGGIEAINAFSLTGTECTGESFSGSITVKSKVAGYQIKINSITATIREITTDIKITMPNPKGLPAKGIPAKFTFIPYALKIIVGIDITIVTVARNFITIFKLFDITEAKASIIPLKIPL